MGSKCPPAHASAHTGASVHTRAAAAASALAVCSLYGSIASSMWRLRPCVPVRRWQDEPAAHGAVPGAMPSWGGMSSFLGGGMGGSHEFQAPSLPSGAHAGPGAEAGGHWSAEAPPSGPKGFGSSPSGGGDDGAAGWHQGSSKGGGDDGAAGWQQRQQQQHHQQAMGAPQTGHFIMPTWQDQRNTPQWGNGSTF